MQDEPSSPGNNDEIITYIDNQEECENQAYTWIIDQSAHDFGPIDIVAYNMKTKRFLKADVKYLPHRLPAPNRNKKSQARRTKSKFQIEHNVKFITVDENGNCKII